MRLTYIARRGRGLALIAVILPLLACPDGSQTDPMTYGCTTQNGSGFPTTGEINILNASSCPIAIAGIDTLPFTATAELPNTSVHYGYYNKWVTNYQQNASQWSGTAQWSTGTGKYFVQLTGNYTAGTGGQSGGNGYDDWHHEFLNLAGSQSVFATSRLGYKWQTPTTTATGPSTGLASGANFEVVGATDDPHMSGPVTYTFYLDGNYVASGSSPSHSFTTGSPGWDHEIDVYISDGTITHVGAAFVHVCDNGQFTC